MYLYICDMGITGAAVATVIGQILSLIVAMMQIKLFSEGELEDKSDDELNALMKSF